MKKLTPLQQRFCEEYLIDLNATAACIRAGYKNDAIGRRLVTNSNVSEHIQELKDKVSQKTMVTIESVIQDIKRRGELAEADGQFGPAIKAAELLGKHVGAFEKDESSNKIIFEQVVVYLPDNRRD